MTLDLDRNLQDYDVTKKDFSHLQLGSVKLRLQSGRCRVGSIYDKELAPDNVMEVSKTERKSAGDFGKRSGRKEQNWLGTEEIKNIKRHNEQMDMIKHLMIHIDKKR